MKYRDPESQQHAFGELINILGGSVVRKITGKSARQISRHALMGSNPYIPPDMFLLDMAAYEATGRMPIKEWIDQTYEKLIEREDSFLLTCPNATTMELMQAVGDYAGHLTGWQSKGMCLHTSRTLREKLKRITAKVFMLDRMFKCKTEVQRVRAA